MKEKPSMLDTFGNIKNCTYTGPSGANAKLSIETLVKIIRSIPKPPKAYSMDFKILKMGCSIPENTIIVSHDIAKIIEEAFK